MKKIRLTSHMIILMGGALLLLMPPISYPKKAFLMTEDIRPISLEPSRLPNKNLKSYILEVMEQCRSPLSPVAREVRAADLSNIVPVRISTREGQEHFILILCIENKFLSSGKSSAGAIGIAQIMPKFAQDFADLCKLGILAPGDLEDPSVNTTLGACFFNSLLLNLKSPVLAVASYNAGAASSSVKNLKALISPVPETSSYVAKVAFLKESINALETNNN